MGGTCTAAVNSGAEGTRIDSSMFFFFFSGQLSPLFTIRLTFLWGQLLLPSPSKTSYQTRIDVHSILFYV